MHEHGIVILQLSNHFEQEFLLCAGSTNTNEPLEASSILTEPPRSAVEIVIVAWAIALGKFLAIHKYFKEFWFCVARERS